LKYCLESKDLNLISKVSYLFLKNEDINNYSILLEQLIRNNDISNEFNPNRFYFSIKRDLYFLSNKSDIICNKFIEAVIAKSNNFNTLYHFCPKVF